MAAAVGRLVRACLLVYLGGEADYPDVHPDQGAALGAPAADALRKTVEMTAHTALASADEIRTYLIDQLNHVLRRPGMYGDVEASTWMLIDHLLVVERRSEVWNEQKHVWRQQGVWTPTGVKGALSLLLPPDHGYSVASVYAEFARQQGWLKPDRVLDVEAYVSMRNVVPQWGLQDRVWADVLAAFGPPSVLFGGSNPLYGKALGYVTEDPSEPMLSFHLWNGAEPGTEPSWPPAQEEPVLLAIRCGDGPFADSFTFTPEGKRRRPEAAHMEDLPGPEPASGGKRST
ncbi:hypothetical protein ABZ135_23050 [Streptomyces sp. NPDC006339]|uniref:hypothetical protein n=1 Tax=Streptomyces sp. NPDC006339 TaxID=3156755 RepID=UPI0033AB6248